MEVTDKKYKKPSEIHDRMLTERQIKRRVGKTWALLENPIYERGLLTSAKLLYFNEDKAKVRKELRENLEQRKSGHYALRFYGTIDPNLIYIL